MRLTELFLPETVVTDMPGTGKEPVLRAIVADLDAKGFIADAPTAAADVLTREDVMSTGVGHGVAIPHAYTAGVERLVAGFYRIGPPIDFGALDSLDVDLIFVILGPPQSRREHIRILAKISRLLGNADFRDELRRAADTPGVLNVFRRFGDR
ncbi:MAG TPA: PTS sugar transporter subunit IIA [Candidatus Krumholzibacteria bacterium]|nr:PTS sugar transporter subunit IIA [Candidatus Krumholzibacteria bacterium]